MLPLIIPVRNRIFGHYTGFSWFIFIWISRSVHDRKQVINHEKIHFHQQAELLFVPHWILYGWYYLLSRRKGLAHHDAYRSIPFEREAYENEGNPGYLGSRQPFAWRRYV